jgi:tetratricopeptide (TPR) repeat protein
VRFPILSFLLIAALPLLARADDEPLKLDPKQIINDSSGFLKDREPEMTAEEYAVYERVVDMLRVQPALAITLLEGMMTENQQPSPAFEFILGNAYFLAGQKDKAEVRYLSAVNRYPTFVRAWYSLGVLYYTTERFDDAVRCLSQATTLGDREPATLGLLGYCLEHTGNTIVAEVCYMQALAVDAVNTDWMDGLLRIYVQRRQFESAEILAKSLIRLRPADPSYWLAYANILISENRKLDAMIMLEASAGAGVAGPRELNMLADLYAEQGLNPEAISAYQKLIAVAPEQGERQLLRFAQVLIANGRLKEAEGVLDGLPASLTPVGRIGSLQARSDLFAARKQWIAARKALEELLKEAPLNGKALLSLGEVYATEGDFIHAGFALEAAYKVPETTYQACIELANIELKNRHFSKCAEYLQTALNIERTDELQDYLDRVKALTAK